VAAMLFTPALIHMPIAIDTPSVGGHLIAYNGLCTSDSGQGGLLTRQRSQPPLSFRVPFPAHPHSAVIALRGSRRRGTIIKDFGP
jgi:hypothetical protein